MSKLNKIWQISKDQSLLLVFGSLLAVVLANIFPNFYISMKHLPGFEFLVNEVLMTLFFAVAGKEVIEAIMLKNGSLRGKKALGTVVATVGGILGPVIIFGLTALFLGSYSELKNGWAIPTATDIAFAYLVGKIIFGKNHPAVGFLLAIAILDDAMGLIILAMFYPSGELNLYWMLGVIFLMAISYGFRKLDFFKSLGIWPYVAAMIASWFCFHEAGIHPVLSAIPILIVMPHSETDSGVFAEEEKKKNDLLNIFEHKLDDIIPIVLGLFGFINAGVIFSSINEATWAVTLGLLLGKPLGIFFFGLIAMKFFGLPKGMTKKDVLILGAVAGIGFTVSLFVSIQAYPEGVIQEGAKMGALFSFFSAFLALVLSKLVGVRKIN